MVAMSVPLPAPVTLTCPCHAMPASSVCINLSPSQITQTDTKPALLSVYSQSLVQPRAVRTKSIAASWTVSLLPFPLFAVTLPNLLIVRLPSEVVSVAVLPLATKALVPGES